MLPKVGLSNIEQVKQPQQNQTKKVFLSRLDAAEDLLHTNFINNKPLIFIKKQAKAFTLKTIPLNVKKTDLGNTRHFPSAAQEWNNSIYAYNTNYSKVLPIADKNLIKVLESYLNFQFKKTKKKDTRPKGKRHIATLKRPISRELPTKKIFLAKGDLKHTSFKTIITIYIFNTEKKFLIRNIKKQIFDLYFTKEVLKHRMIMDKDKKLVKKYNRPLTVREFMAIYEHKADFNTWALSWVDDLSEYYNLTSIYFNKINLFETTDLNEAQKFYLINAYYNFNLPNYKVYLNKVKLHYMNKLTLFVKLLMLNQLKFKTAFLSQLNSMVSLIYQKEIEFKFVNLKQMHLNSDIFTQAVTIKLKNRENRLYRVLKSALNKVKLSPLTRFYDKYNNTPKKRLLLNTLRNLKINSLFSFYPAESDAHPLLKVIPRRPQETGINLTDNKTNDCLNKLLLNIYPKSENVKILKKSGLSFVSRPVSLINFVLRSLKHTNMAGIRLEAKGRLTRRFTASRSVFKLRLKGGLKNIDSSFRGLSAVILRGHVKSNVQYTNLNSKNRNGAFGVKGWVSSK